RRGFMMSVFLRALSSQNHAASEGFDWDNPTQAFAKVEEEFFEVKEAYETSPLDHTHLSEEIGDLLLAIVTFCKHMDMNPETVLDDAVKKFDNGYLKFKKLAEQHNFNVA